MNPGGSAATPSGVSATSASSAPTAPPVSANGVRGCAQKRGTPQRSAPQRAGADRALDEAVGDRGDRDRDGRLDGDEQAAREVHVDARAA